jgi:hypothetical protein
VIRKLHEVEASDSTSVFSNQVTLRFGRTQGEGFVNQENVWERSDGACGSSHLLYRFSKTPKEKYPEIFPEFANKTVVRFAFLGYHVQAIVC